ncbi:heme peroxidase, plant/fungal/bacterial [Corchorus capsularis]|uniref:Heme peroxidase, plant/fungal/bacterial n=1 Tax=Corchorus capsularis TaxID=210143 RepID=A0A1R3IY50_COCAP|nr:heme peroxidase, plant/fungal/bacterial [Corchorus capsularis]
MMSLCFCSLIRPSPLIFESNLPWNLNLKRSICPLGFSIHGNNRNFVARVVQQGFEVNNISLPSPVVEEETEKEVNGELVNGVAGTELVEDKPKPVRVRTKRADDYDSDDESFEGRFKLRNGKEVFEEKAYLVGVERKGQTSDSFGIEESLKELTQLADTAGLMVVGSTYQKLASPNPRTYIGSGKVAEIKSAINAFGVETVIFDDELSPGQLRNLEKVFGGDVRVCDRTALILDIFNQRAATHEAALQVALAQMEYQLPRLTKMWTHLERQAGGQVKGMGEKQIEVDKRILRTQIGVLKKELESVRKHRKQYRNRRTSVPVPVVSLVGYTNAGKSTLLNQLTGANVLSEDKLFATLDPTTRRVQMKNGSEFLLTDTVGFIQKLPTTLVAAFRATLEEISESSLLVHVVDISHPLAEQQINAVDKVLSELDVSEIPKLMVWNKVDRVSDLQRVKLEAERRGDVVCVSALTGDGLQEFCNEVQEKLKDSMVPVEALVPFDKGELLSTIHQVGVVEKTEYTENGTFVKAFVPLRFARLLTPMRQMSFLSATLSLAHPGLGFGWGNDQFGSPPFGLFPQFYQFSCPQADDIVMSVLEKAIAREPRMAASLLRLHFHDCFVQSGGPSWELPLGRRDSKTASLHTANTNIPPPNSTLQNLVTLFQRQGLDQVDLVALSGGHTIGVARCATFKQRLYNQNGNNQPDETLDRNYYFGLKSSYVLPL